MKLPHGYLQLYTGSGKGKTTAALGLALRAAGAGLKVYIAQFAKGIETSELKAIRKLSAAITVRQCGARSFIRGRPGTIDRTLAENGLAAAARAIASGRWDLVILDELCVACHFRMVEAKAILEILKNRPRHVEVLITGRNAPRAFLEAADLVTEMREVRHYFSQGIKARKGIEY